MRMIFGVVTNSYGWVKVLLDSYIWGHLSLIWILSSSLLDEPIFGLSRSMCKLRYFLHNHSSPLCTAKLIARDAAMYSVFASSLFHSLFSDLMLWMTITTFSSQAGSMCLKKDFWLRVQSISSIFISKDTVFSRDKITQKGHYWHMKWHSSWQ